MPDPSTTYALLLPSGTSSITPFWNCSFKEETLPIFLTQTSSPFSSMSLNLLPFFLRRSHFHSRPACVLRTAAPRTRTPGCRKGKWRGVGERALRGPYHVLESSSHPNLKKHCMDNAATAVKPGMVKLLFHPSWDGVLASLAIAALVAALALAAQCRSVAHVHRSCRKACRRAPARRQHPNLSRSIGLI